MYDWAQSLSKPEKGRGGFFAAEGLSPCLRRPQLQDHRVRLSQLLQDELRSGRVENLSARSFRERAGSVDRQDVCRLGAVLEEQLLDEVDVALALERRRQQLAADAVRRRRVVRLLQRRLEVVQRRMTTVQTEK